MGPICRTACAWRLAWPLRTRARLHGSPEHGSSSPRGTRCHRRRERSHARSAAVRGQHRVARRRRFRDRRARVPERNSWRGPFTRQAPERAARSFESKRRPPPGELDGKLFGPKPDADHDLPARSGRAHTRAPDPSPRRARGARRGRRQGALRERAADLQLVARPRRPEAARGRSTPALQKRLSSVAIQLPPLRSRREDIPLLVEHFSAS